MMNDEGIKIVRFDLYCPKCKNYNTDESKDPCDGCLSEPCNQYSRKPVNFEEKWHE